jgi:pyruvate formate lyase activating enzyme
VRYNEGGKLRVPWGYVAALQADPIEKKPFFHVQPGSDALTFGMLGCDFHCSYCQNHLTSQAMRDPASDISLGLVRRVTPEQMVQYARRSGASVIASSYNEPLITSEWAAGIFQKAKEAGLKCVYISNGNVTPEVLEFIRPYLVGYKIDLKTMQDKRYRQLGGVLENVLEGIRRAHDLGLWVEVVTLVVPGFNDSNEELMDAAQYIRSVSADIPWHVTAFHPDYKMTDPSPTSVRTLLRAAEIGLEAGLNFVYAGNLPGYVDEYENTYCPNCRTLLIKRYGYVIEEYHLTEEGNCPKCGTTIPGVWPDRAEQVKIGGWGMPRPV